MNRRLKPSVRIVQKIDLIDNQIDEMVYKVNW